MSRRARNDFAVERLGSGPAAGGVRLPCALEKWLDRRRSCSRSEQLECLRPPLHRHRIEAGLGQPALQGSGAEAGTVPHVVPAGSNRRTVSPEHVEHRDRPDRRAVQLALQVAAGDLPGQALDVGHDDIRHPAGPQHAPELGESGRHLVRQQMLEDVKAFARTPSPIDVRSRRKPCRSSCRARRRRSCQAG
ncbi:MAG: hypothetical protein CAPSK01_003745 [Candidatus Accumulibacter vicinus]|uniref:Uncharacterized protein n=1 Tax=Candidatus Accumulibacter vicinus TaxID=2954382 RepID=A0A084XWG3_9PROT|nr:MAG: hypothetical protein CAPSK01_003745 [Candidatus Accumulibacter vicinus]